MTTATTLARLPLVRFARALSVVTVEAPEPEKFVAGSDFAAAPAVMPRYDPRRAASALLANPWLAKAVSVIAMSAAALPLQVQRRDGDEWTPVPDHPFAELLARPTQHMTQMQWRAQLVTDLVPGGNAWMLCLGDRGQGLPLALMLLEPHRCEWIPGPSGAPIALEYDEAGTVRRYDPADVVHIRTASSSPDLGRLYGTGIVQPMDADIASDVALAHQMAKKAAKGRPDAAFVPRDPAKVWGPPQVQSMRTQIDRLMAEKAGGVAVMSGSGKFEPLDWNVADMGGTELREWARSVAIAMSGVPPTLLGLQSANYATAQMERKAFVTDTLTTWCRLIDDALTDLCRRRGYPDIRVRHIIPDADDSATVRIGNASTLWTMGADPAKAAAYFGFDDVADVFPFASEDSSGGPAPAVSEAMADVEAQAQALAEALTADPEDPENDEADIRADAQALADMALALLATMRGGE